MKLRAFGLAVLLVLSNNVVQGEENGPTRDEWGVPTVHKELEMDGRWEYGQIHFQRREFEQFIMKKLKTSLLTLEELEIKEDWKATRAHFEDDFEPLFAYYIGNTGALFHQKKDDMNRIAYTLRALADKYKAEGDKTKLEFPDDFDKYSSRDIRYYCKNCHIKYLKE